MGKHRIFKVSLLFSIVLLMVGSVFFSPRPVFAQSGKQSALVITLNGELTPVMVDYLSRGLSIAKNNNDEMIIIEIDTPGGAINLMQAMVEAIQASPVPVVVYVTPNGAMAGSAGTLITLAGEVVAMAPGTIIGAASPVSSTGQDLGTTEQAKVTNAMVALAQSLTVHRSQAAQTLAADTIQNAKAVSAYDAKQVGLADFIATDLNDLLLQLNGYTVTMPSGPQTLQTVNLNVQPYSLSFIEQTLGFLIDPNIVFLLLVVGIQALLIELASPGGWVAGFVGAICLALAVYGLGILPVNWFGIAFIFIAFILFIVDIKAPTHGALTAAGVATFIIGGLVLFNTATTPYQEPVSVPLVVLTGIVMGIIFFTIIGIAIRAQKRPVQTGRVSLVGRTGLASSILNPNGSVQIGSELWTAELVDGESEVPEGTPVIVTEMKGFRIKVKRLV